MIIGSRIFYTTYKRIEKTGKEDVYTYYIRSMDLKGKDKKMHGWLYRQTAEALRELASYPAWKEYDRLIKKVFEQE